MTEAETQALIDKAFKDSSLKEKIAAATPEQREEALKALRILQKPEVIKIICKHVWNYVKSEKQ